MAFTDVGADHARGVEAARVVHHNGCLADRAHVIERDRERGIGGLLAHDDLDQHHLVDRREEMHADEVLGVLRLLGWKRSYESGRIRDSESEIVWCCGERYSPAEGPVTEV